MDPSEFLSDNKDQHRNIYGILSFYYNKINNDNNNYKRKHFSNVNYFTNLKKDKENYLTNLKKDKENYLTNLKKDKEQDEPEFSVKRRRIEGGIKTKKKTEKNNLTLKEYNEYAKKLDIKPSNSKSKVHNSIKNIDINQLNLKQLKVYCKFNNIKNYSKLNKEEIIKLLKY